MVHQDLNYDIRFQYFDCLFRAQLKSNARLWMLVQRSTENEWHFKHDLLHALKMRVSNKFLPSARRSTVAKSHEHFMESMKKYEKELKEHGITLN